MTLSWAAPPGENYPESTCQECGRVLTRGGMLCAGCQYGMGPHEPEADAAEPEWTEPKVVVYESRYGLVIAGYVWSQRRADAVLERERGMGQIPRLVEVTEVRRRQAEARVGHPAAYRSRLKL